MKKHIIILTALLLAAAGSVGALAVVKSKQKKEQQQTEAQSQEYVLFKYDAETISNMAFDCKDGHYEVYYDGEEWQLASNEFLLDQTYIQNIQTYAADLTAVTDYGDADANKKAMYGLDDPIVITVESGQTEHKIYLGAASPTGEYYYAMVDDRNKVYAIDAYQGEVFEVSRLGIKTKALISCKSSDVSRVVLRKNGAVVYDLTLDEQTGGWSLPKEYSLLTFDNSAVTSMLALITRLSASYMLDETLDDMTKYGFDKPHAEMTFDTIDGREYNLLFSSVLTENNAYTYVLLKDSGQVEMFYTSDVDFIEKTPLDFVVESAPVVTPSNITGFELTLRGEKEIYNIDMPNYTADRDGVSFDLNDETTYNNFQNFYNAMSVITLVELDISAEPELTDPLMSVLYHTKYEGEVQIDLVDAGNGKCYVFRNGEYTCGLIDINDITGKNSTYAFHDIFVNGLAS